MVTILLLFFSMTVNAQLPNFDLYPVYNGKDLGLTYRRGSSFSGSGVSPRSRLSWCCMIRRWVVKPCSVLKCAAQNQALGR